MQSEYNLESHLPQPETGSVHASLVVDSMSHLTPPRLLSSQLHENSEEPKPKEDFTHNFNQLCSLQCSPIAEDQSQQDSPFQETEREVQVGRSEGDLQVVKRDPACPLRNQIDSVASSGYFTLPRDQAGWLLESGRYSYASQVSDAALEDSCSKFIDNSQYFQISSLAKKQFFVRWSTVTVVCICIDCLPYCSMYLHIDSLPKNSRIQKPTRA